MKLIKVSKQFDIFLSEEKDERRNPPTYLIGNKIYYRFMERFYIPDLVYKLSPEIVIELNNLREKYAQIVIDKEFNDLLISNALEHQKLNYKGHVRILDFGCGYGYASKFIKVKFPDSELLGVDIREPLKRKLLKSYNEFSITTIDSILPYEDNFYDIIVSFFVFHFHVSDIQIKELSRVIKKSGTLFLNLINSSDFEVLNRLAKAGFKIVKESEIITRHNKGKGYFYCLKNAVNQ